MTLKRKTGRKYSTRYGIVKFILFFCLLVFVVRKPSFRETLKVLLSPATLKPFTILVLYFMMYQFSGVNTVTFYAVEIFKDAGTPWDENTCTILMGIIRLLSTIVACISMRRCGRRPLTFISSKSQMEINSQMEFQQ